MRHGLFPLLTLAFVALCVIWALIESSWDLWQIVLAIVVAVVAIGFVQRHNARAQH